MTQVPLAAAIAAAVIQSWLVLGVVFAVPFLIRGVVAIDPLAAGSRWTFRLLLLPGVVLLWPWLLLRWVSGAEPRERNAHLDRARERTP